MATWLAWKESISPGQVELEATVTEASDFTDALTQLMNDLPATYGDFVLSSIGALTRVEGQSQIWKTKPVYRINAEKKNNGELRSGEFEFSFSSSRQTIKRTISLDSKCYDESGEINPSDRYLINCDPETGKPRGIEEVEYLNAFRWRVAVPFSTAAEEWRRAVGGLRGSLNQEDFFGYEARSVIFEDIVGSVKADELYVFDLSFTQKDHATGIVVGGITVGNVDAWNVIDASEMSMEEETFSGKTYLVPKVQRVKIHRTKLIKSWSAISAVLGMS